MENSSRYVQLPYYQTTFKKSLTRSSIHRIQVNIFPANKFSITRTNPIVRHPVVKKSSSNAYLQSIITTNISLYLIILTTILCLANTSPVSYQYVKFVRNGRKSVSTSSSSRRSRSYGFGNDEVFSTTHYWDNQDIISPHENSLIFEEHRGHITPDFSDGLEYPDPLLLTGVAAKRAASFLYRKPLFFGEINHVEALYRNQEQRRRSGLAGNKLGSLRPQWPFYRFKQQSFRYF